MPLTDQRSVLTLRPKDEPYYLTDTHGLQLRVGPDGSKSWSVRYRVNGRQRRLSEAREASRRFAEAHGDAKLMAAVQEEALASGGEPRSPRT